MPHYIYYLFFIIHLIELINTIVAENENDIINYLSSDNNEFALNINSEVNITNEIIIKNSIKKLYITGNSPDFAKLNLKYLYYIINKISFFIIIIIFIIIILSIVFSRMLLF